MPPFNWICPSSWNVIPPPFVDAADLLLDIHSMGEPCAPLMVCGTVDKNAALARELGMPAELLIDTGHPGGQRMIERGGLGDPASPRRET